MNLIRTTLATILAPALALTGRRFGKHHRHEDTRTYRFVDTVRANRIADKLAEIAPLALGLAVGVFVLTATVILPIIATLTN